MKITLLSLVLLLCPSFATATRGSEAELANVAHDYADMRATVAAHSDEDSVNADKSVDVAAALEHQWQLGAEWLCIWLDDHPKASEAEIREAYKRLDPELETDAMRLPNSRYLVVIGYQQMSTVFAVKREEPADAGANVPAAHFRVVWTIRDPQPKFGKELSAWQAERNMDTCYSSARDDDEFYYCGPLLASLLDLSPTSAGAPRFAIAARVPRIMGCTGAEQFSVWQWDDDKPRPLHAKDYLVTCDQHNGTVLEGPLLTIGMKRHFRTFDSCGQCEERQTNWMLRITPATVDDLGEVSLTPELDALDEVIDRIVHNRPATELADEKVIELLKGYVEQAKEQIAEWNKAPETYIGNYFSLGMLGETKVTHLGSDAFLCFQTDDVPGPILFRMQTTTSGYYFASAHDYSEGGESALCLGGEVGYTAESPASSKN